ncbi:isoflavone reductase [Pleomassaria siparia CBS 279.74]|uniref:Isoflavone reductase n=1 Tax=Pleomassaria siparia CBS 279.74 TaxID=1314801 RepID=A0A6G1K153_9PLEO|nr:isoflavone reductase [Pleomassaria siparia CBS 279.74]
MSFQDDTSQRILLIGAGELGSAILPHLQLLPNVFITVGVRSVTKYTHLGSLNTAIQFLDITGPELLLTEKFAQFDVVISCTGFGQEPGRLMDLARQILAAGKLRESLGKGKLWFFPWQWGVDYDITGDADGLMPLFGQQVHVRNLLRSKAKESNVKWTILSTGIFMSFLFQQTWGVIEKESENVSNTRKINVSALRDLDHKVTVTDVSDIGKVLARIMAGAIESEDRILYVAGDTVSYKQLADIIRRATGEYVHEQVWTMPHLKEELAKDPDNLTKKYRVVFAGHGVSWDKQLTVNHQLEIPVTDVETYAREHLSF